MGPMKDRSGEVPGHFSPPRWSAGWIGRCGAVLHVSRISFGCQRREDEGLRPGSGP